MGIRLIKGEESIVNISRTINKGETTEDVVRRVELEEEYNINYK